MVAILSSVLDTEMHAALRGELVRHACAAAARQARYAELSALNAQNAANAAEARARLEA